MPNEFTLDDESIPLHVRRDECVRLLDLALYESKRRGNVMAEKKRAYYTAKAQAAFALRAEGNPVTFISDVLKGCVADEQFEYDKATVEYENAKDGVQVYKLKLRVIEAEIEREWNAQKRM